MLKGFKDFLMRGNVVDLAVAVVIGTAFTAVVTAFVTMIMDLVGLIGGTEDFSGWVPGGVHVGSFITAVISFVTVAAVVYFLVVMPMNVLEARRARGEEQPEAPAEDIILLREIRDELRRR